MSIHQIVIIGAGPAGIATAIEAIKRGQSVEDIVILERSGEIAHMINSKYPDEKPILANYKGTISACIGEACIKDMTKKEFFDYLHDLVKKYKLNINFHQDVRKIKKLRNGQLNVETEHDSYTCNVVFVAIGNMAAPRTLGIPIDNKIANKVFFDIQKVKSQYKNILVVGGGDSSAEYCKILCDRGHNVFLSYRGASFSRMIEQNALNTIELINNKKLTFFSESLIEKIDSNNDCLHIYFKENKYDDFTVDGVVVALGTERPTNYLNSVGINTETESGEYFAESKMGGLFFVGDLANKKGGTINLAFNSGVKAVNQACDMYLDCPLPGSEPYLKKQTA